MTNSSLINLETLIDDAKCFEILRQLRWPQGVSYQTVPASVILKSVKSSPSLL